MSRQLAARHPIVMLLLLVGACATAEQKPRFGPGSAVGGGSSTGGGAGSGGTLATGGSSATGGMSSGSDAGATGGQTSGSGGAAGTGAAPSGTGGTGGSSATGGTGGIPNNPGVTCQAGSGQAGSPGQCAGPSPKFQAQYVVIAAADTIAFTLQFENNSGATVPISDIKLRYYFTNEEDSGFSLHIYDAKLSGGPSNYVGNVALKANVTQGSLAQPVAGADSYFEFSFGGDVPFQVGDQGFIKFEALPNNYALPNSISANDYSFNCDLQSAAPSQRITLYDAGQLAWGCEPAGSSNMGQGGEAGSVGQGGEAGSPPGNAGAAGLGGWGAAGLGGGGLGGGG